VFEDCFLRKAFYLHEVQLDNCLHSLLHLLEVGQTVSDSLGFTYVLHVGNLEMKVRSKSRTLYNHLKHCQRSENFNWIRFCLVNGIMLDRTVGQFPCKFKNYTKFVHALKLSYSLFITLKMWNITPLTFQRGRGGRFHKSSENLLTILFLQIYHEMVKLGEISEKKLIKVIKNSLCYMVSVSMDQSELPAGVRINLLPADVKKHCESKLSQVERVQLYFSFLQGKSLCQEVPESFIQETLEEHRAQLSSAHPGVSAVALTALRTRGQEFGKLVRKYYNPEKGFFPSNRATCQFPRNVGGVKGDLVYNERLHDTEFGHYTDPDDRIEPFVIGLFGLPGSGKSKVLPEIISRFASIFPGVHYTKLCYERTCNTEHWDGYTGQPIVILDDLGQSTEGKDIREFQTLVSSNPYTVPMASLEEKGQKFCSPIIIATSNLAYGWPLDISMNGIKPIIDDGAFWRRFHFPIHCEVGEYYQLRGKWRPWLDNNYLEKLVPRGTSGLDDTYPRFVMPLREHDKHVHEVNRLTSCSQKNGWRIMKDFDQLLPIFRDREKYHNNIRKMWTQHVVNEHTDTSVLDPLKKAHDAMGFTQSFRPQAGTAKTMSLQFPAYPPHEPLPVRVEPIVEPLKVRTITAGVGDTFCLKGLQRAMWFALGEEPQFCLTHGTKNLETAIKEIFQRSTSKDVWISGDYSAATDSFSIEASRALLEGILESIDHEPTKRWAMKEISPHLLLYPKDSGLAPVLQESGQLMGSLLSFPLLCLLNDCTARSCGLDPRKYLINGDDILMRAEEQVYFQWKDQVADFGLKLSLGKNYIHRDFGTVNSQLIFQGEVLSSGKQKVVDRRSHILGSCLRDLEVMLSDRPDKELKELFVQVNRKKLARTVRNIHVPVSHGGLSFSWSDIDMNERTIATARMCYLNDMFNRIKPQKGHIAVPYLSNKAKSVNELQSMEEIFNSAVTSKEYHEDFLTPVHLKRTMARVHGNYHLRENFRDKNLRDLPSLSFLHTYQVPFTDEKLRKELQAEIDAIFFRRFFSQEEFGYDVFRKEFLQRSMNLSQAHECTKHLVELFDINVSPDMIQFLDLDFKCHQFCSQKFEKSLGTVLRPKDLNVLPLEAEDFSEAIIESYWKNLCDEASSFITEENLPIEDVTDFKDFVESFEVRAPHPIKLRRAVPISES